jgi:AraC family transcriptional regulator
MTPCSFDIDGSCWAELTCPNHAKKENRSKVGIRQLAQSTDFAEGGSWHTLTATADGGVPVTVTRMAATEGRYCIDLARRLIPSVALYVALPCLKSRALAWDGSPARRFWLRAGDCIVYGPTPSLRVALLAPFDLLHLAIPRLGGVLTSELSTEPGVQRILASGACQMSDPTISGIAQLMAADVSGPERGASPIVRHLVSALSAHLHARYTGELSSRGPSGRGFATWQERRAIEMLTRGVGDTPNIAAIARACGLSPDRFIRLFKLTTGMPPHRWLRRYRVDFAKKRLLDNRLALSEIALSCGFSDQSHFTRVFLAWTGLTPGEWRRMNLADHRPEQWKPGDVR